MPKKFSVIEIPQHISASLDEESKWLFEQVMKLTASVEHTERAGEVMHRNLLTIERKQRDRTLQLNAVIAAQKQINAKQANLLAEVARLNVRHEALQAAHAEVVKAQAAQALIWAKFTGVWGIAAFLATALTSALMITLIQYLVRRATGG